MSKRRIELLVQNRWNKKDYNVVTVTDSSVTLERMDKTVFTIKKKEYYENYIEKSKK